MMSLNLLFDPFAFDEKYNGLPYKQRVLLDVKAVCIFLNFKNHNLIDDFPDDIGQLTRFQYTRLRYLASCSEPIRDGFNRPVLRKEKNTRV